MPASVFFLSVLALTVGMAICYIVGGVITPPVLLPAACLWLLARMTGGLTEMAPK